VKLADVGGDVEKEREPANPAEELHFADHSNLRRQSPNSREDLPEELEKSWIVRSWRTFKPGIPFFDVQATNEQRRDQSNGCNDTKHLKLCGSKKWESLWQVDISKDVSKDVSNAGDTRRPSIGRFLLMSWRVVDDERPDASLY
jgi:hypothetical protein